MSSPGDEGVGHDQGGWQGRSRGSHAQIRGPGTLVSSECDGSSLQVPVPGLALCPPPQALVGGSDSRPAARRAGRVTRHIRGGQALSKGEKGVCGGQGHPGPGSPGRAQASARGRAGGRGFGGQHQPPGAPGQLEASPPTARGWSMTGSNASHQAPPDSLSGGEPRGRARGGRPWTCFEGRKADSLKSCQSNPTSFT